MDILNFISWIKGGRQVTTVDPSKTLLPVGLKDGRRDDGYLAGAITVTDFLALVPGGLEGTSFIVVKGDKATPEENGLELQAAYDAAKLATPYGEPLNSANRFTIFVAPGFYFFDTQYNQFVVDAENIDIKSLSGDADVYLSGISVSSPATYLKGLNTLLAGYIGGIQTGFNIDYSSNMQTFDTCVGGDYSFGFGGDVFGNFINCIGGNFSFAGGSVSGPIGISYLGFGDPRAIGTFIGCTGVDNCFGSNPIFGLGEAGGTFTDCKARDNSFGFYQSTGVFKNCTAQAYSFANKFGSGTPVFSGTGFNCVAQLGSFGTNVIGTLYYSKLYGTSAIDGNFSVSGTGKVVACINYADALITL
jgi:hypothetical protein